MMDFNKKFNFTVFLLQASLISEGAKVWDGMMGLLYEDKVDAAVGTIFYLKEILTLQKIEKIF